MGRILLVVVMVVACGNVNVPAQSKVESAQSLFGPSRLK